MRNLKPLMAAIMLCVCSVCSFSQDASVPREPNYKKAELFASLPENIKVNINALKGLLNKSIGDAISSNLNSENGFAFSGHVVCTACKYNNTIQSVVIRSANYNGASLVFTRVTNEDGSAVFSGRILSFSHSDAYELQYIDGNYEFVKKKFHQLINE